MKRLLLIVALFCSTFCLSCSEYDDSALWDGVNSLEARVAQLEELCQQMNTNISSLQTLVTALQGNDYVKSIAPITKGEETIGYTITFSKSDPITIYNGERGHSPVIGVKADTDGQYYWTMDGSWLVDASGNKIIAQGQDGITPQLKVEDDFWYISYDNGKSWLDLGEVTEEWVVPIFQEVTYDEEYVYITFADGTEIVMEIHDTDIINFKDPTVWAICVSNWDTDGDGELSYEEAAAVTDLGQAFRDATEQTGEIISAFPELKFFTGLESIPYRAFSECYHLRFVQLPNSITTIGDEAFCRCSRLKSITIPDSVITIGDEAFYSCKALESITIGNSVTTIGEAAFSCCEALESITIGNSVTTIGNSAFSGCEALESITIPNSVTTIGAGAFSDLSAFYGKFASTDRRCLIVDGKLIAFAPAGLISYTIPDGVTSIGSGAFYGSSSLTSITIPDSVVRIEYSAFSNCSSLTSITIPDSVVSIEDSALSNCSSLENITIPNSVTWIGNDMFSRCTSLKSVTLPNNITWITGAMFNGCSSLESITIPDSVVGISNFAFSNCSSLKNITIPDDVTIIGSRAFYCCYYLETMYCKPTAPPTCYYDSFDDTPLLKIYVPSASVDAYKAADGWANYDDKIFAEP